MFELLRYLKKVPVLTLEAMLFIVLLPPTILLVFPTLSQRKKKTAMFAGLEHVIDKTTARADWLKRKDFEVLFYSREATGHSKKTRVYRKIKTPKLISVDLLLFVILLSKIKPMYLEIYYTGRVGIGLRQLLYVWVGNLTRSFTNIILRGELYYFDEYNRLKKLLIRWALQHVKMISYRETYMNEILNLLKISPHKIYFDPNKVVVKSEEPEYPKKEMNVLFLNSFKDWRRVDLVIKSIPYVISKNPNVKFIFVGARNEQEMEDFYAQIKMQNIPEETFELHPWTENSTQYYEKASIFVLPADLVYLNYSLLEAMERGLVPVIANVKDADKIVFHGKDGYLVDQDEREVARYIGELVANEGLRNQMARNARAKVISDFNDDKRMVPIFRQLQKRFNL